jgi:hypothetical protein
LINKILPLDGAEVLDEVLMLAAPKDEGAFGDAKLRRDSGETDALGTELDELLNGFLIFHKRWICH